MTSPLPEPFVIADHPALDLLNTVARIDGAEVDFFGDDADVARWLVKTGWLAADEAAAAPQRGLCDAARKLRAAVRTLVARRKAGERADPAPLNAFLAQAESRPELVWDAAGAPRIERRRGRRTPEQLLAPLAESAADLLSAGDFDLVRPCGNPECVLWFYDRTKSHRRRWCRMAACGNRHKVAAFRQRRHE